MHLRKSDLAKLVGKSPTSVAGWESGVKRPTAATVAQLALVLGVDPAFFAVRQTDVAALSGCPHFRSLRTTTQLARDEAFAYGKLALDVAFTFERHVEFPAVDVPRMAADVDDLVRDVPERAARHVRNAWMISGGPIRHMIRLLEIHGVIVVFSPPQSASVDAYSFDSFLRPVVVLNPMKHDYYRQRFDVAHELGHIVMHGDAEPGGRIVEEQANRFAAELLMPANQIHELLPTTMSGNSWSELARLKEQWGVSMQALLYRARRLGRLRDVSYRNAMTTVSARGWRRSEPGQVRILEQPSLLPKALEMLEADGVSDVELMAECRVPAELFRTATRRTPAEVPVAGVVE
jgi:Zn-dependent peptidase ImmA (M78 family)/transcriptional regulator with XRE-family HTH domain